METNQIYVEPCLETLKKMPDNFLDCVITSPPYWQLRDYGYEGQWGLEPTFNEYLENLWSMMDEIYRVLKPTGTCWINLGDTYNTISGGIRGLERAKKTGATRSISKKNIIGQGFQQQKSTEVANKCLLLIPHRFAIGCIDRGWIVRNDIVWAKRNAMPESCTDRFAKKHEYFFFMTKSEKYFFDLDAIRDKTITPPQVRNKAEEEFGSGTSNFSKGERTWGSEKGKNPGSIADFWDVTKKPTNLSEIKTASKYNNLENEKDHRQGMHQLRGKNIIEKRPELPNQKDFVDFIRSRASLKSLVQLTEISETTIAHWYRYDEAGFAYPCVEDWNAIKNLLGEVDAEFIDMDTRMNHVVFETDDINKNADKGKNPGSVCDFWDIPTKPSTSEHYASYNDELIRKPILAGCPEGGIVYDPFMGTGSTAEVCLRSKRLYIGSEMSENYVKIANKRLEPFLMQQTLF
jgi:site-specific DNA-methyltransferase (adenine-specific)